MRTVQKFMLLASLVAASAARQAQAQQSDAPPAGGTDKVKPTATTKSKATDKAKPAATKDQAADQPTTAPPAVKSKLDPNASVLVDLGYADWGLRGNQSKFLEYATPPHGFFLRDFRYAPVLRSPSEEALFELRGIGQDDYRAVAQSVWGYGETRFSAFLSNSRFYDPSAGSIAASNWHSEGIDIRRALTRDFSLSFQGRANSQQLNYQSPYPALDQNTSFWNAIAGGKFGRGDVRLSVTNFHYSDETRALPDFNAQSVGLSYLWQPSRAIGIEAAGTHAIIQQPALPSSHIETLSLGSDVALGAATDLALLYQHRQLGLPTVQNAYVRQQNTGTFSLAHYFNSWRAQVGLRIQDDERVNGDQTYVDVPKWSTLEGRLYGRLTKNIKLTLRGSTQSLSDPPASVLSDPRTLYWTNRNLFQARLEAGNPNVNGYLVYTYRVNRNSQRSTDVTTEQYTLGSTWQISPLLNLFAEFHHENWTGRTDTLDVPTLSNFLPDSDTGVVELNWYLGRRSSVSLSYTGFATYNDNPLLLQDGNTRGSFVTINTHYRLSASDEIGLLVAPWTYHDTVASPLNYDAAVVMVTGSARF